MLVVYAYSRRVLKTACELGLDVAVPLEFLEEARRLGCLGYVVLSGGGRPRDVVEAKWAGARGIVVLAGGVLGERLCRVAESLGLECIADPVVAEKPLDGEGVVLYRPRCLFLKKCLSRLRAASEL